MNLAAREVEFINWLAPLAYNNSAKALLLQ